MDAIVSLLAAIALALSLLAPTVAGHIEGQRIADQMTVPVVEVLR